jgi:hypothetical protein
MCELVPYFFVNDRTLGWICGTCKREFELMDGDESTNGSIPPRVQKDFDSHSCLLAPSQDGLG